MKNVCFVQHASEWPLFSLIAKYLEKYGTKSFFVSKTPNVYEKYKELGFNSFFISSIFNDNKTISTEEIEEYDFKYGPPTISQIGDSDVQMVDFFGSNVQAKSELIVKAYKFWEDFIKENNINYFIVRETATFATRTAYNVCRKNNIPIAQFAIGPNDDYFTLDDVGEGHMWTELVKLLEQGPHPLNEEENKRVDDFINARIGGIKQKMELRFVPPQFFTTTKNLIGLYRQDNAKIKKEDPVKIGSIRFGRRKLIKKIVWKYITKNFLQYDEPKYEEKYVYCPVYSGEETSYLVNDHYWAHNEMSLIKEVAFSLPKGYFLYVKEHPTNPGDLTFKELSELASIPNIRILRPTVDATEIIKNSQAVFVLQGTTGWEAFLAKIPVIILGTPFFSYSNLVYKVNTISKVADVVWKAIKRGKSIYDDNEEEWQWFIYSVLSSCGRGESVKLTPPYGFPTDKKNAEKIASIMYEKIIRDLNK